MSWFRPAPAVVALRTIATALLLSGSLAELSAQEIELQPGVMPGILVHLTEARDTVWCEITVVIAIAPRVSIRSPATAPESVPATPQPLAQLYNTTGTTGPEGRCPAEAFAALDGGKLAVALNATDVYLSPTPLIARRFWVMDELRMYRAGETADFMGVAATWVGTVPPEQLRNAVGAPYEVVEIHLESKFVYRQGSTIFLLRSPDSKTWVMQSYTTEVDAELTFEQLTELRDKLKLPPGWTFETQRLTRVLTVDPRNNYGTAHIVRDDLHNVYEGCGFDTACSYVP